MSDDALAAGGGHPGGAAVSDTRPTLTPERAAERLGLARLTVFALMDSGRLRSVDIGTGRRRHRRTSEAWLAEFLAGRGAARGADVPIRRDTTADVQGRETCVS